MAATLGAFDWTRARGIPGAGEVGLETDPVPGYANVLVVSVFDRYGNDRTAVLSGVAEGDTLVLSTSHSGVFRGASGAPAGGGGYIGYPFVVSARFDPNDEPTPGEDVTLYVSAEAIEPGWPTADELAQVLDVANVADWAITLARVLASAIDATKGQVGDWETGVDTPDDNLAAAALRLAELMSERPDATVESLVADASFRAHMAGKHRRFGIA